MSFDEKIKQVATWVGTTLGAAIVALATVWAAASPGTAPDVEQIRSAWETVREGLVQLALVLGGIYLAGKSIWDAFWGSQRIIVNKQEIEALQYQVRIKELDLQAKRTELGIDGELDVGP